MTTIVTLEEARAKGLTRYFTGKPCKNGHIAERYTKKSTCLECDADRRKTAEGQEKKKAYQTAYYQKNKEVLKANVMRNYYADHDATRERARENRLSNIDHYRNKERERYTNNREKIRAQSKQRAQDNPQLYKLLAFRNNTKQRFSVPVWDVELRELIEQEAIDLVIQRNELTSIKWHVDHIIPAKGKTVCGLHVWNNLQVVPATVNHQKSFNLELDKPGDWLRDARFWSV